MRGTAPPPFGRRAGLAGLFFPQRHFNLWAFFLPTLSLGRLFFWAAFLLRFTLSISQKPAPPYACSLAALRAGAWVQVSVSAKPWAKSSAQRLQRPARTALAAFLGCGWASVATAHEKRLQSL